MAGKPVADVRTRILEAALSLLADHGVTELTQPKVARLAGVRQSHLTYYFPTRADLMKAVATHSMATMLGQVGAADPDGPLTPEGFAGMLAGFVTDKRRARVMLGLIVASDEDPGIKAFLREFVARVRTALGEVSGRLGGPVDATSVAAFHALMVGTAVLNVARDDAASRRDCRALVQFAVTRVFAPDAGAPVRPRGSRRAREEA